MKQLPVRTGNNIFAINGNVPIYRRSSLDSVYKDIYYPTDTPIFGKDQLIGVYTGRYSNSGLSVMYEVMWEHKYRKVPKFPPNPNPTREQLDSYMELRETIYGWVVDTDIYTDYVLDPDIDGDNPNGNDAGKEVGKDVPTKVETNTEAGDKPKSLFASIFGPTIDPVDGSKQVNKNAWWVLGIVTFLTITGIIITKKKENG